mmetsp:Transcript_6323/g.15671  ORF Transcript_6323/g.15671 Transcript_6323/m.15671 type:complete len:704 (+) Transcript_6323:330-2441(+)
MATTTFADFRRKISCGRKRACPTRSPQTWKIMCAVTFSASVVATIAFQQSLPVSYYHRSSISRLSTAVCVLTEPTNLVKIESTKSVEERAALEELYLLSSLAKKATRRKLVATQKTRRKKKAASSSFNDNTEWGSATEFTPDNISNSIEFRDYESKANAADRTAATKKTHRSTNIVDEKTFPKADNRSILRTLTGDSHETTFSTHIPSSEKRSKKIRLNGLTTVPNRRNQKKKTTLVAPLREGDSMDQDEYIRNLLRKKEKYFSHDWESSTAEMVEGSQCYPDISEKTNSKARNRKTKNRRMIHNSRSSTMPGFREASNTFRKNAHADGMTVARKNSRIEFVESKSSRSRRITDCGQSMYKTSNSVPDSLVQFANEIHSIDRITPEEEIRLGEKTQEALRLQHVYNSLLTKLEREPTDDEWCAASGKFNMEAIAQIIDEGLEAKNKLVSSNLRMVQGVVNVYIKNGLEGHYNAGDLMQEGILALMRAAEKFDPTKGFRFSTYAMYWIRSAIKRDQLSQSRIIRVPQRLHETHKKISVNRTKLKGMLQRCPTQQELSKELGITVQQIERCETAFSQKMFSLDQNMVNRNNPLTIGDTKESLASIVATKSDENDYNESDLFHLREDLLRALQLHLTDEEANILILKFGIDDDYASSKKIGRSIIEVGKIVDLKPDKVRRIIKRSLKRLESTVGDEFRFYNRDFCI